VDCKISSRRGATVAAAELVEKALEVEGKIMHVQDYRGRPGSPSKLT